MKILSIDFDAIMGPSIEIYNNHMGSNCTCENFEKFYPLMKYVNADLMAYRILTNFLIKIGVSEEIAEDGKTAKVAYEIVYGDGSKEEQKFDMVLVDGAWKQEIKK